MNRILFLLPAFLCLQLSHANAQGAIQMVSTYNCSVPATALLPEADDPDSLVTRYDTEKNTTVIDTLRVLRLRYDRESGKLLEKQVALTDTYLKRIGYTGLQRPYFYQYRYDETGRLVYYADLLQGQYRVYEYTGNKEVVKTFDAGTRKLVDQEVVPALANMPIPPSAHFPSHGSWHAH